MSSEANDTDAIYQRIRQREQAIKQPPQSLGTPSSQSHGGNLPNTILAVATIAFLLGGVFCLGAFIFLTGGLQGSWWATPQLGFFIAAWAFFHWGEFAVTAGWNLEKCTVDCKPQNSPSPSVELNHD
jgi:protein-S-isoprenylcysteine O-methyltransferase